MLNEARVWPDAKLLSVEEDFDLVLPTRYNAVSEDMNWSDNIKIDVSYRFTNAIRRNQFKLGKYGSGRMTCRMLYAILVKYFNRGEYFIETYFERLFQDRFKKDINALVNKIKRKYKEIQAEAMFEMLYTRSGNQDRRSRGYKKLSEFEEWKDEELESHMKTMSRAIRKDIQNCLATGKIPLWMGFPAQATMERRMKLGLDSIHAFYASGDLINHLVVYYKVEMSGV